MTPLRHLQPYLGGHVSAAGGLALAIDRAEEIGADAIQIFGASPRQWQARMPTKEEIAVYRARLEKSRVKKVFLHAAYLVNLASPDVETRKKSIKNLAAHLKIADLIGADGLIFHVGSGKELPKAEATGHVAVAIHEIFAAVPGHTPLLMENAAGGGQKIGAVPEDFAAILKKVPSPRLRICFDTAHAFEAGIIERYEPADIKKLLDAWDAAVGLERINALHINDSKTAYNSHHDRHENLGEGFIGIDGFKNLAKEKRLAHTTWLLEVPGFANEGPDKKNMDILRSCFTPSHRAS